MREREVAMPRNYFINPYNFVPLGEKPLIESETDEVGHLWFDKNRKSGKIDYSLKFVTPFIIPGEQDTDSEPGKIELYTYQKSDGEYLAIPGSRLRGHILNLMRAINSSPVVQYENKDILKRYVGRHKKGFLIRNVSGNLEIYEVDKEYLVVHPDRRDINRWDETIPVCYAGSVAKSINPYDSSKPLSSQGTPGDIYYKSRRAIFKFYLTKNVHENNQKQTVYGRWVKFPNWSGLDDDNQLPDLKGNLQAHHNAWHIVDLNSLGSKYPITDELVNAFKNGVDSIAKKVEENHPGRGNAVRGMNPLKEGQFVYFETDSSGSKVISIGRHYHYIFRGDVQSKVNNAQAGYTKKCVVQNLAGIANEENDDGMKSRLWFEMAMGPQKSHVKIERKNLRILSSQPPKSHNFYLKGGDYDCSDSRIRGRKFYWHNPHWRDTMWDNEDTGKGEYGFENAFPGRNKAQWSNSEIIMAEEQKNKQVSFNGTVRFFNLTDDELNLLMTALVGIGNLENTDSCLKQSDWKQWCHKIGHARPFMGSAYMEISKIELLKIQDGYIPKLEDNNLEKEFKCLQEWQKDKIPTRLPEYLRALQRMMSFGGAWDGIEGNFLNQTRITYPLGQNNVNDLVWNQSGIDDPTTYLWFMKKKDRSEGVLPDPAEANKRQSLKVWINPPRNNYRGGRGGCPRQHQHPNPRNQRRRR